VNSSGDPGSRMMDWIERSRRNLFPFVPAKAGTQIWDDKTGFPLTRE
jgi:hypothetical protein